MSKPVTRLVITLLTLGLTLPAFAQDAPVPVPPDQVAPPPAAEAAPPPPLFAAPAPAPAYQTESSLPRAEAMEPSYDPRPPSGMGGVVVGIGGAGFAALSLAGIGLCYADPFGLNGDVDACIVAQTVLAVGGLVVSVVGLSIGVPRRARYKAWRARQRSRLDGFNVASSSSGAALTYRLEF